MLLCQQYKSRLERRFFSETDEPIDFNQSGYNAHQKDINNAEAVLLELVSSFKELVGKEPQDLEEFLKDPCTYTGELLTQGVKVAGLKVSYKILIN